MQIIINDKSTDTDNYYPSYGTSYIPEIPQLFTDT